MSSDIRNTIKELTLLLMYLTSWKDNNFGIEQLRSWKGYSFDIINELIKEDLISDSYHSKSVVITQKGEQIAKKLLNKYYKDKH